MNVILFLRVPHYKYLNSKIIEENFQLYLKFNSKYETSKQKDQVNSFSRFNKFIFSGGYKN